jgi:hypothetical protein
MVMHQIDVLHRELGKLIQMVFAGSNQDGPALVQICQVAGHTGSQHVQFQAMLLAVAANARAGVTVTCHPAWIAGIDSVVHGTGALQPATRRVN